MKMRYQRRVFPAVVLALGVLAACGTASPQAVTDQFLRAFFAGQLDQAARLSTAGTQGLAALRSDYAVAHGLAALGGLSLSSLAWQTTCQGDRCIVRFQNPLLHSLHVTINHGRFPIPALTRWIGE
ncbi:MAG: hypothetical protein K6U87_09300 [Firmicutes bacterium]|nr:hypothetical protein [Bacillota bacterium]